MDIEEQICPERTSPDLEAVFLRVAELTDEAQRACQDWESGGDPDAVGEAAEQALIEANIALAAVRSADGGYSDDGVPETRRHRLIGAAYLCLLAGADEHGESGDLAISASLFRLAAAA